MRNRMEEIKSKGFNIITGKVDTSYQQETTAYRGIPNNTEFSKIKIGAKVLDDAILELGDLKRANPQLADKATVLRAIDTYDLKTMREISDFFYRTSGIYNRIVRYMAFMYRYDWYITPYKNDDKAKDEKLLEDFHKCLQHLDNFHNVLKNITTLGLEIGEVSVDKTLLNALPSVYDVISYAEATSNMSNLTGLIFGPRGDGKDYIEMMKDYRTKNFSPLIKRRFVIGSYVLQADNKDRYFHNAQRVRRLLVDTWNELFKKYDAVILPVETGPARYLDETKNIIDKDTRILKEHLQIANFGGFPSITIPDGFIEGLPVGLNLTGKCYDDCNILNIAYAIESTMNYKNQIAKEVEHV